MNEISTIYFRAKGKGYGVFQSDSNNQKQMLMGFNNYAALNKKMIIKVILVKKILLEMKIIKLHLS